MHRKIALIDPIPSKLDGDIFVRNAADFANGSPVAVREPIGIEYIGGYIKQFGYDPIIIPQGSSSNEDLAVYLTDERPLAVGISFHSTYLYNHSLDLAQEIKKRNPSVKIIIGGYHPSGDFETARRDCVDFVVYGEGEESFRELLDHLCAGKDASEVAGTIHSEGGNLKVNSPRKRLVFSKLPWPIRDAEILSRSKCAPLCYPSPPKQKSAAQISYSRGCPYGCDFCASPLVWGSRLSYRSPRDVVAEIEYLQREFGTNFLFFNDLSFNVSKKKAMQLTSEIRRFGLRIHWFAYATIHGFDYELAKAMRDAGCSRLGFGVESVLDSTLKKIKYRQNLEQIKDVLDMTSNLGMLNRCYMMIGWPWESKETLQMTEKMIRQLSMDQIRIAFVIPFPGTDMHRRFKHRIVRSFDDFTGDSPVMLSDYLTIEELEEASTRLFVSYYNSDHYKEFVDSKIKRFPHLKESYDYFLEYLGRHDILRW